MAHMLTFSFHQPSPPLHSFNRSKVVHRSSRILPFHANILLLGPVPTIPVKKGRAGCSVHQNPCSHSRSELNNLNKPEVDQSNGESSSISAIRKAFNVISNNHFEAWVVPWTAETIIQVMLLWVSSFWLIGSWIIPLLAHASGLSKESLTVRGQALYSLLTDMAEGLVGVAILHHCLAKFSPLPADWFKFSLKGDWHFDVALGCLFFPLVNRLSQVNLELLPTLPTSLAGASSVEQSIMARDSVAMALYAAVVSLCAPVWEEIIFRGFLLPSLTRYTSLSCAVFLSAVAFAMAHFNAQRMLPLMFLGVVMGVVYVRSRNLLSSMLLHSLWNWFVFLDLMK